MFRYFVNAILVAACTYSIAYFGENHQWGLLSVPIALLLVQSAVNVWLAARESKVLAAILELIHDELGFTKEEEVRLTVLRPNQLTRNFRQIARSSLYQPEFTNHKFHIDKGVAGLARRNKGPEYVRLDGNFHKTIRETLGFTEKESRAFSQKAEYFCLPIFDKIRHVKYMLCLDSNNYDVLTEARRKRLIQIIRHLGPIMVKAYDDEARDRISAHYS